MAVQMEAQVQELVQDRSITHTAARHEAGAEGAALACAFMSGHRMVDLLGQRSFVSRCSRTVELAFVPSALALRASV